MTALRVVNEVAPPPVERCDSVREACFEWIRALDRPYVLFEEMSALAAYMRSKDEALWLTWLDESAARLLTRYVGPNAAPTDALRGRSTPTSARSVFSQATKAHERGNPEPLGLLAISYVIDERGTRAALKALTYDDLKLAINGYDRRAKANAMEAAYLRAVQKRLPVDNSQTVGDVLTNDELNVLRDKHVTAL